jgi:hypothetical protein
VAGNWSNYTITFPSAVGSNISVRIYGEDISKNQNATGIWFWWNVTPSAGDTTPPTYSLNSTNSTLAGTSVSHNLYWQDNVGLSYAIFSFDNCTGSLQNITGMSLSGTSAWSNFTVVINSTVGCTIRWKVYANDTSNNWNTSETFSYVTTTLSYLEVNLEFPSSYSITQNQTFTINATVFCRKGACGNVYGTIRYNASSPYPDTPVNTSEGEKPFYIQEPPYPSQALKSCPTNPLEENEFCNLTWIINATGDVNSVWKIGVLFNSSQQIQNHTSNSTITIVPAIESLSLSWSSIDFGFLIPNTQAENNPAPGNSNNLYNITNTGTCNLNLWIKGSDLTNSTFNSLIAVGNLSWSNSSSIYNPNTVYPLDYYYKLLYSNLLPNSNLTTYYWLSVPSVYAGIYKGTITICGNCSSTCD